MFDEPIAHFLIHPGPLERMGIVPVVLRASGINMRDKCLATDPGCTPQIAPTEGVIEQLTLIVPGCMCRGKPWSPPRGQLKKVLRLRCGMTWISVLNQKSAAQMLMAVVKPFQRLNVMCGILRLWITYMHLPRWHGQPFWLTARTKMV